MSAATTLENGKAATRLKHISVSTKDMHMMDPRTIKTQTNFNRRDFTDPENIAHVERLAESIAHVGVLEALTVRFEKGYAVLVNGECRLRATMLCIDRGIEIVAVPVVGENAGTNDADRLLSQGMRNTSKGFTDLEWASVIKGALDMGRSEEQIASYTGKPLAWVEKMLELAAAPEAVKHLVANKTVAAGTVVKAIRQDGAEAVVEALETAVKAKTATGKVVDGTPIKPTRVTAKNLLEGGTAPPSRAWKKAEAQGMCEALRAIVAINDGELADAQRIAINILESLEALV